MFLATAVILSAQDSKAPSISAAELVRETVAQEIAAANDTSIKHMFRSRKRTPKGSQTRLYVETNEAMAGMLMAVNDRPLTRQQEQAEIGHLDWLKNNPDALRKKHSREMEDAERSLRIVKALPDAFRYAYAGTKPGDSVTGKEETEFVRVNFTPNPSYSPPSRVEQVLAGMEGYLLIDVNAKRIAEVDGTLTHDVSFGWGIIGRLDKGGHYSVRQADIGDGAWEITEMNLNITGKILLLKNLNIVSDEVFSDFRRVPADTSFARGVQLLLNERERLAHPGTTEAPPAIKN